MKVAYFRDTDLMYITLKPDSHYKESEEVAPGVVLDFDDAGNVLAVEIYTGASEKVDLSVLLTEGLPTEARSSPASGTGARGGSGA